MKVEHFVGPDAPCGIIFVQAKVWGHGCKTWLRIGTTQEDTGTDTTLFAWCYGGTVEIGHIGKRRDGHSALRNHSLIHDEDVLMKPFRWLECADGSVYMARLRDFVLYLFTVHGQRRNYYKWSIHGHTFEDVCELIAQGIDREEHERANVAACSDASKFIPHTLLCFGVTGSCA
jgi:hypothetical protein